MLARALLSIGSLVLLAWPVAAQPTDANLITAIDASGSIKAADEHLELEGIAQAVIDPRFLEAVARGYHGRIGFVAFTWADGEFTPVVPWTVIGSKPEAEQVAERLRTARDRRPIAGYTTRIPDDKRPRRTGRATDVSAAIERAIEISAHAPFASWHNIINICASGIDKIGNAPDAARDRARAGGLTVNGLILGDREDAGDVAAYFRDHVQAGPGSFVIEARGFRDITHAMLAKFVVELAAVSPPGTTQTR